MILQPEADKSAHLSFAALLDLLNHTDDEFHAVCHESESVTFNSRVTDKQSAAEVVAGLPDNANVWFSVNPTKGPARIKDGRGGAADVTRLAALFADLDVKPGGCADDDVAHAIIDKLSEILGTGPMAITYSGHGVQPYWPVIHGEVHDDDDWDRIDTIIKRWGRLVQSVGKTVGAEADSVFNLDRILRVPETVNNKFPADPTPVVCYANGGRALTLDKIGLALNVYGIDSPIPSESPGRDFYGIDSESSDAEIKAWVKATFNEPDSMCYGMRVAADKWVTYIREEAQSHPYLRDGQWEILNLAVDFHTGWNTALIKVEETDYDEVVEKRGKRPSRRTLVEISSARDRAARKIKAVYDQATRIGEPFTKGECPWCYPRPEELDEWNRNMTAAIAGIDAGLKSTKHNPFVYRQRRFFGYRSRRDFSYKPRGI